MNSPIGMKGNRNVTVAYLSTRGKVITQTPKIDRSTYFIQTGHCQTYLWGKLNLSNGNKNAQKSMKEKCE